jgi:hypothetical protein
MQAIRQQRQLPGQGNGFWALLVLNAGRQASDPRDMVYGASCLADDLGDIDFLPDYSLSIRKIYEDVVRRYIVQSKKLNLICARQTCSADLELSSWIPDWSVSIKRTHLAWPIENAVVAQYTAAASSAAEFRFEGNGSILEVSGLCVDIVSGGVTSAQMVNGSLISCRTYRSGSPWQTFPTTLRSPTRQRKGRG